MRSGKTLLIARDERASQEIFMSALTNGCVAAFRKRCISIVLAMALAFPAVAAHEKERGEQDCPITGSMPVDDARHVAWHRQQSGPVELDSLTGFLRLFATIADELAARGASSHEAADEP
jgi:hypothetical protein